MMALVMVLFLRYVDEEAVRERTMIPGGSHVETADEEIGFTRRGFVFATVLGLSFTNHLTTVLLAPAFVLYFSWTLGDAQSRPRLLIWEVSLLCYFVLALVVRSLWNPLIPILWLAAFV